MVQTDRSRKQRVEHAISLALERRWNEAADENRALLDGAPDDVEAANRLGKALSELDDLAAATEAYERALEIDPANVIARKNLARIDALRGSAGRKPKARNSRPGDGVAGRSKHRDPAADLRIYSLVEESGKSAELPLLEPNVKVLRRVCSGDPAVLATSTRGVVVKTATGARLGALEPRVGLRLKRMIEGGNRYAVIVRHIAADETTVYIRETHTDPSLAGQTSFVAPAKAAKRRAPRAYTKTSAVVQHARDEASEREQQDELNDEQDGGRATGSPTEQAEMEERGFSAAAPADEDVVDDAVDPEAAELDEELQEFEDVDEDEERDPEIEELAGPSASQDDGDDGDGGDDGEAEEELEP